MVSVRLNALVDQLNTSLPSASVATATELQMQGKGMEMQRVFVFIVQMFLIRGDFYSGVKNTVL